jgi:hypothetical protein
VPKMLIQTRICDLCNEEMTDYIPQIQLLGKPKGGWKMMGYSGFNDICEKCHNKILAVVLGLRVKGAAFRLNIKEKDEDNENESICRQNKEPQYKKHMIKV